MLLATWNVNSVRARYDRLVAWLDAKQPDVLCLQELKCEQGILDALSFKGYEVAAACQRTYNGVAILSKRPLLDVRMGLQDSEEEPPEQARLVAATIDGIRILSAYVPNGGTVGSDKFAYKLRWMDRLHRYLARHADKSQPLALCGDFNVAPEERDVHDPKAWEGEVLFHPDVRRALSDWSEWGLTDAFRIHNQEPGLYSWWDYRQLAFPKNRGLRIDHVFVTESLGSRVLSSYIDRNERKGSLPSDHAPVVVSVADEKTG